MGVDEGQPFKGRELHKISNILDKFENLSRRVSSQKPSSLLDDHNSTKGESL